ncbi:MAG: hypothetical protein QOE61_5241, partial [Micromonosporaceae bacterium]|nr:hypothetical protein [Micromonosporaceae bacterium]
EAFADVSGEATGPSAGGSDED